MQVPGLRIELTLIHIRRTDEGSPIDGPLLKGILLELVRWMKIACEVPANMKDL